jgi:hypothetical protein
MHLREEDKRILTEMMKDVRVPRMVRVKQHFPSHALPDVSRAVHEAVEAKRTLIRKGARIAVAVGSRGVNHLPEIVRATIDRLKANGAEPFIVPAMGSHGGATAEGQREVLEALGVTENAVGAPIRSSMEVVTLGVLPNGLPVYMDKYAYEADGIVVINRIKPHTAFRGPYESGLLKMITIGLGKQKGAESCHAYSFKYMAENIPAMAKVSIAKAPILFGVGVIEDAYDQTAKVVCLTPEEILEQEPRLLQEAKDMMPKILVDPIDVLIIDEIGKDISGDGMDPNITGRYPTPYAHGGPEVSKMVVLRLTERTHGNANGIGTADFTTAACFAQIDPIKAYVNGLTSTVVGPVKLPMTLPNDRLAIQAAIKTSNCMDHSRLRVVRIKNTLKLSVIYVSETILPVVKQTPGMEVISEPAEFPFDIQGNLTDLETAWLS